MTRQAEIQQVFRFNQTGTLTSYIQPIGACKLCKRRHVVGVVGQDVGLLSDALGSLLDALIVCVLQNDNTSA